MPENLTHSAGPPGVPAAEGPAAIPASPPGYELLDEIGRGGMGVVYRARDTALVRDVAVKLLSDRYPADSPVAQRFLSEARITGQLQHPGIPAVHQVGTLADGRPFLAMKLIKGSTLESILKDVRSAGFSPLFAEKRAEARTTNPAADRGHLLAIFEAVCQAVGYAHAHRVIHRDLKPANVMVGAFGEVQVMDWGLAKVLEPASRERERSEEELAAEQTRAWTQVSPTPEAGSHTQAGSLVGTPAFIPPEQALGEIDKVNERADVFGLGAVLAMILTGRPPYVGDSFESVRVQAVRGKLDDCFARLDASGAEPELVALCKQCLAFEPADRPADAGAVAQAVAGLRAVADERARRAELERVRVEGEQATAQAQAAERRKRRRLALGAAAVLAVAMIGGLVAVLAVQRRANADLADKNAELANEQAKVEARFELAQKAIALFHTGVSEDFLLKNPEFKDLRTKLLKEAADFYADQEKLLAGQTDIKSRKALAAAYFQLGELTDKIGDKKEALAVHRQALALRRELAAAEVADVETRPDVARSLRQVVDLLITTGDNAGALAALKEQRDLAERLETEPPTGAVRSVLAQSYNSIGLAHYSLGNREEALTAWHKTLPIWQKLADANLDVIEFQRGLATCQHRIAIVVSQHGKQEEALVLYRKALAIRQKLADDNPAVTEFQRALAGTHNNIGLDLVSTGKPAEALIAWGKALEIRQNLAEANPAVSEFQKDLGGIYENIGDLLSQTGRPEEAMAALLKALALYKDLAKANPAVREFQFGLARTHEDISHLLSHTGRLEEAMAALLKALAITQEQLDANPKLPDYQRELASVRHYLGRLLAQQKRFAEAFTAIDAGLAIHQKLAEAYPELTEYRTHLGYSHAYRGWALVRSGQPSKAAADLRQAVELWAKDPGPWPETQFERSRALALLAGLGGEVTSGVTTVEASQIADRALAALRDAISAGWNWPNELKEPDFDALRGRDDFKKLLADLEAKAAKQDAESK
jgi:serine/threonine protein kinase/Tfp pilus assembly protein PilF